jgi:ATP-dependent exoDNAse (exonuclease V) alpha subunit
VIDEASMLTEEMLAAVIDSLGGVERLVLCGDHRQLPPIGAGRPFADLVKHLRDELASEEARVGSGAGLAELSVGRRQRARTADVKAVTIVGRDDLAVASWFSVDGSSPAADEAFARVMRGEGDGTLVIDTWTDEDDLHGKIIEILSNDRDLALTPGDADTLKRSLGATGTYNGRASFERGPGGLGAENWQILSPVRSRPGGILGLNRLVRRTWRAGDTTVARKSRKLPAPMGADEILFHDKVMCIANHGRDGWILDAREKERRDVANGEIGMAVEWFKAKGLKVEFSTQPGVQFTFWADELNAESDRRGELLELAYAVTVHKVQGSQFGITFVVVPNPCPLLSPELLYTALTRQRERAVLLVQGDPAELRLLASPWQSETGRRLTCLFRPADPFESPEGRVLDGSHVHRTARGEMVRSKSEVIVANILDSLGAEYAYEAPLEMLDGTSRLPDFTISRTGKPPIYWEHLGMLDLSGYRADWDAKLGWYASHDIRPWSEEGGAHGTLVWSMDEGKAIDAQEIRRLAEEVLTT